MLPSDYKPPPTSEAASPVLLTKPARHQKLSKEEHKKLIYHHGFLMPGSKKKSKKDEVTPLEMDVGIGEYIAAFFISCIGICKVCKGASTAPSPKKQPDTTEQKHLLADSSSEAGSASGSEEVGTASLNRDCPQDES